MILMICEIKFINNKIIKVQKCHKNPLALHFLTWAFYDDKATARDCDLLHRT